MIDIKKTASKAGISGGTAAGGFGAGIVVYLIAKHVFKIELSTEAALTITGLIGTAAAGSGRAVENAVRFYAKLKKIASEK